MQRRFSRAAFISGLLGCVSCGTQVREEQKSSHTSMDVDVPKEGVVTPTQLKNIGVGFSAFIKDGKYQAPAKEIIDALKVEGPMGEMMPRILATREPMVSLECKDKRCRVISRGDEFSFEASWINVPLFGKPTIYLEKVIDMELVVAPDAMKTEVCRLSGIRGKAGMLTANVDGLRFELEGDAIKEFVMDTGSGGSYPTNQCSPLAITSL